MKNTPKIQQGLWIENKVLYSDLTLAEKVILADILAITSNENNKYFKMNITISKFLNISLSSVNRSIASLIKKDLIHSRITYPYENIKRKRVITPNMTVINNLSNNL